MYDNTDILYEDEFVYSFKTPLDLGEYLIEQYLEDIPENLTLVCQDLMIIKQAFLNHKLDFFYMECMKFEELYLRDYE